MSIFRVRFNNFHRYWKAGKLLYLLTFIAVFVSACSPPKNVTLLNKPDWPPVETLVWSPTGNELAVTVNGGMPPSVSAIYILDVKTKKMRLLVKQDFGQVNALAWTPDGKQLAYFASSFGDGKYATWLADPNSTDPPKVLFSDTVIGWAPSGEMIIVRKDIATQAVSLYLHNIRTNDETNIFSEKRVSIKELFWSSDGFKLISVSQNDTGRDGISIFDSHTKKTIQITSDGDVGNQPWSPDGKMIAYARGDPNSSLPTNYYLHITKSDGSCDVEVPGHFRVYSPVWSPDGKQVAYIGQDNQGIYLLDLVGAFGEDIVEKGLPCP